MSNRWMFFESKVINVSPNIPLAREHAHLVTTTSNMLTIIEKVV